MKSESGFRNLVANITANITVNLVASLAIFVFALTLVFLFPQLALASDTNQSTSQNLSGTDWRLSATKFGAGSVDVSSELYYENSTVLRVSSTEKSMAVWRLWKIIPHPDADDFYVRFKIRVYAPDIDLDRNAGRAAGEATANDGPNIFAFLYYGTNNTTLDKPGFDKNSFSWYARYGDMCHIHIECNYLGPNLDYMYCLSEDLYKGWLFDGKSLSDSSAVNQYDSEPISQGNWKTVSLHVREGECARDYLSLVIMGADILSSKSYRWEITNVTVEATTTYSLPLDKVYDEAKGEYLASPSYCGDGIKQSPNDMGQKEECDGQDGVIPGWECTSDCKLQSVCGDNLVVGEELCDGKNVTKGYKCSSDCKSMTPICGDNYIVEGEELCDGKNVTQGFECLSDCKSMKPVCGDGLVVGSEECDTNLTLANATNASSGSSTPGYKCINCKLVKDLGTGENLVDELGTRSVQPDSSVLIEADFNKSMVLTAADINKILEARNYDRQITLCTLSTCEAGYATNGQEFDVYQGANLFKLYNKNGTYYLGVKKTSPQGYLSFLSGFKLGGVAVLAIILAFLVGFIALGFIIIVVLVYWFFVRKRKK